MTGTMCFVSTNKEGKSKLTERGNTAGTKVARGNT